ncbi:pPIWI_RE module domain-containing protein [Streptomyces synnematoformans]|uniref:DUF3893 domain-containing protein n=1 Tax=Streptomyces synnematoformans TaxID=415721 RepID=A0ABN2XEB9_9ACTN
MPVNYRSVRAAAWLPTSADSSYTAPYRILPFPEEWHAPLLELCNTGRHESAEPYRTVPTWRMDQVLQALAPDILVRPRTHPRPAGGQDFWLCVPAELPDPLPAPAFRSLLNVWLRDLRPEPEHAAVRRRAEAALAENVPRWETRDLELVRCPATDGGTAAPQAHQYQLTSDWLARRVLALGPYDYGAGQLAFRAAPRGPRDQGAELISEPVPYEEDGRTSYFSMVLNITVQTVPFEPLPRFHLHTHVRRWATRIHAGTGRLWLPRRRMATVFLRPRVPWLPGAPASDRFAVARLGWAGRGVDWDGRGPASMLRSMSITESFPDAAGILQAPVEWLTDDMRAAVVHSTAMGSHGVGPGWMSDQRSRIVHWAEQALPEQLRPLPELRRSDKAPPTPANARPGSVKPAEKQAVALREATERRAAAAYALRSLDTSMEHGDLPVLRARLLWQTEAMRRAAIAALAEHLGLKGDGQAPPEREFEAAAPGRAAMLEWQTPELVVRLRCLKLGGSLGDDLPLPDGTRPGRAAVTAAAAVRRAETAAFLRADGGEGPPSLALVEIDRRQDFTTPGHDPKFALRLGCADAGVLTQFMVVPKKAHGHNSQKNVGHRALKAWDDGLRQLGVRVHPEHSLGGLVPPGLGFAAVWRVQKNRGTKTHWPAYEPVAVRVVPEPSGDGLARVEGWDRDADGGAGAWVPYPRLLLRLTRLAEVPKAAVPAGRTGPEAAEAAPEAAGRRPSWQQDREVQRRRTEEWLQEVLASLRGTPTLLLAHAQNFRSHWTWLQDGRTIRDKLRTGLAPARRLPPDLRLVRVRTARGRETAQWWGVHPKGGPNGVPAGMWCAGPVAGSDESSGPAGGDRVFWSTTPKPPQGRTSSVEGDKLTPRPLRAGKRKGELTIDTGVAAWNPALVELAVLGCHPGDGDNPEALALAVHQLRQAPDYPPALSLPLPLHLAERAQEYVLPTLADEGESEQPEDADVIPASDADPDGEAAGALEPESEE